MTAMPATTIDETPSGRRRRVRRRLRVPTTRKESGAAHRAG
jgi:hypothetical protein